MQAKRRHTARLTGMLGLASIAILGLDTAHPAQAQGLINNGGFEADDCTGWNLNETTGMLDNYTGTDTHSDNDAAGLGMIGFGASLPMDIAGAAGASYIFSSYFAGGGEIPHAFRANSNTANQPYSYTVNNNPSVLSSGKIVPNTAPVAPEPSSVATVGVVALFAAGLVLKARKRTPIA